ncbi:MAG: ATP-binding protein [Acidimicrobiales bacterium]
MDDQTVKGTVELVVPADTRLVRVARLVASGVASTAGFDVEEIEDVRIAVDEGCAALIETGDGSSLLLSFELADDAMEVYGSAAARPSASFDPTRLSLSKQILAVVSDDHELATDRGRATFRIRKRRRQPGAPTSSTSSTDAG